MISIPHKIKSRLLTVGMGFMACSLVANPVIVIKRPPGPEDLSSQTIAALFAISLFIEFCIVIYGIYLSKELTILKAMSTIVIIHIISYPITLLLTQVIGIKAEIFPLVFEPWLFAKLAKVQFRNIWHLIFISNVASFLLGIGLPYVWFHLMPKPKPTVWQLISRDAK